MGGGLDSAPSGSSEPLNCCAVGLTRRRLSPLSAVVAWCDPVSSRNSTVTLRCPNSSCAKKSPGRCQVVQGVIALLRVSPPCF